MIKNRLEYIFFVIAACYLAMMFNRYPSVVVLWMIVVVPLLMGVSVLGAKKKVAFSMHAEQSVIEQGEDAELLLTWKNRSIFPVAKGKCEIVYQHELDNRERKETIYFCVDSRSKEQQKITLQCPHCGKITGCATKMQMIDYFGLFVSKKKLEEIQTFVVTPSVKEILEEEESSVTEQMEEEGDSWDLYAETGMEQKEIREYRPGDSLKHIHWKASAKKNKWMTREMESGQNTREILFFALLYEETPNFSWYDKKMKELFVKSLYHLEQGTPHEVVWYHPKDDVFTTMEIQEECDLYLLAEQIILAGFAPKKEAYDTELERYLMTGMKNG